MVLLAVGAGAYFWMGHGAKAPVAKASARPCPSSAPSPAALPLPQQVRLVLLNGTPRANLAAQVAAALHARGFVVTGQGNNPAPVNGASLVSYGAGARGAATLLARHVLGAQVVADPTVAAGSVRLVLGSGFARLATPAEVAAAATPTPVQSGVPSVCPA